MRSPQWEWCKRLELPVAQGYFLGAFLFLGIVFSLPATLGMASLALDLPVRDLQCAFYFLWLTVEQCPCQDCNALQLVCATMILGS